MKVNKELLRETLQTIKDNPQHWNQADWHCGSSHCFAGFVDCKVRGLDYRQELSNDRIREMSVQDRDTLIKLFNFDEAYTKKFCQAYNCHTNTSLVARFALGLEEHQADELFDGSNTLEDLERIVEKLCTQDEESND